MAASANTTNLKFATQFVVPCPLGTVAVPNIVTVPLSRLAVPGSAAIATGDPRICSSCGAALSKLDAARLKRDATTGTTRWTCLFCNTENQLSNLEQGEVPPDLAMDFVQAAPAAAAGRPPATETMVFAMDLSGSMCVTSEVARNRYVSRLDCVKQAVTAQIQALSPAQRAALVVFSDDVQILGEGVSDPVVVAGEKLQNYDALLEAGNKISLAAADPSAAKKTLIKKIEALEESGQTALGPALLISVAIASQIPGSRVVLCTDGLSNLGLGAIEALNNTEARKEASQFYDRVGQLAKDHGVQISILSIKGTTASLENLGHAADVTGGKVDMVDPLTLGSAFKDTLAHKTIATAVRVKTILHQSLCFADKTHSHSEPIGNADDTTEPTQEFFTSDTTAVPSEIPLQVQVEFNRIDGTKCLRVISISIPFMTDTAAALRNINVLTVGVHVSKKSATLVQEGNYEAARGFAKEWKTLLESAINTPEQRRLYRQFVTKLEEGEGALARAVAVESSLGLAVDLSTTSGRFLRQQARLDETSAMMYGMRGEKAAACVVQ